MGAEHSDAIPQSLLPEFTRQAMSGKDISNFNFGFMNHKGQFLNRKDALKYAVDQGLMSPHDAKFGALTSTMGETAAKPSNNLKDYTSAVKDENGKVYSGSSHFPIRAKNNLSPDSTDGFLDKEGHFFDRDEFNKKFGIYESQDLKAKTSKAARAGTLTSTMMADSKPATAIDALKETPWQKDPKIGWWKDQGDTLTMYHGTHKNNVDSMANEGIKAPDSGPTAGKVSMTFDPYTARGYAFMGGESGFRAAGAKAKTVPMEDRRVLQVEIPKIGLRKYG